MLRDSWQEAWELARDLTVRKLQQADLRERCEKGGCVWRADGGEIELVLLDRTCRIRPPEFSVVPADGCEEIPLTERILALHYLETAKGTPPSGKWITFAEVPGGEIYLPVFRARSIDRLVRAYGGRESDLVEAGERIGAVEANHGDVSVKLLAFPRVPILLTLWRGDEEFSPSGNLLFDASVTDYLSIEDIVVLAGMVVSRLRD